MRNGSQSLKFTNQTYDVIMYLAIYKSAGSQASRLGIALALISFSVHFVVSTAFVK